MVLACTRPLLSLSAENRWPQFPNLCYWSSAGTRAFVPGWDGPAPAGETLQTWPWGFENERDWERGSSSKGNLSANEDLQMGPARTKYCSLIPGNSLCILGVFFPFSHPAVCPDTVLEPWAISSVQWHQSASYTDVGDLARAVVLSTLKQKNVGPGEVAQWIKAFAAKPADVSSVPRTHVLDGENQRPQFDLWPPHRYHDTEVKYISPVMKGNEVMGVLTVECRCSSKIAMLGPNTQHHSIKNEDWWTWLELVVLPCQPEDVIPRTHVR